MDNWCRKINVGIFFLAAWATLFSPVSLATQDVEDPDDIISYLRLVLVEPVVINEILRLTKNGCVWEQEVFWSGSPSEENLRTMTFWMTFSAQFSTQSGDRFWKSFAFLRKDGKILEIKDKSDLTDELKCAE